MGIHSGKFGAINGRSTVRNWNITDTMNAQTVRASNTRGGTGRRNGIESWSGQFSSFGATPVLMPGSLSAFAGYTAPDDDIEGGTGLAYTGDIMVNSLVVNWDWRGGSLLNHQHSFDGHLALATEQAVYADASAPDLPEICATKIQISSDGIIWTDLDNVATATLTITNAIQSYVNSSTGCWTGRKAGPIDYTLAIVLDDNARDVMVKKNNYQVRLYTTDTLFWSLKWVKVTEYSNITVDADTGAIIGATVNCAMNGHVAGVIGSIRLPGAVADWWPTV